MTYLKNGSSSFTTVPYPHLFVTLHKDHLFLFNVYRKSVSKINHLRKHTANTKSLDDHKASVLNEGHCWGETHRNTEQLSLHLKNKEGSNEENVTLCLFKWKADIPNETRHHIIQAHTSTCARLQHAQLWHMPMHYWPFAV